MGSARWYTTRVLLSFVVGLALVPAFVWAIQTVHDAQREPTTAHLPGVNTPARPAAPDAPEPPATTRRDEQPEPRPEPRRARMVGTVATEADDCAAACSLGTIEAVSGDGELEMVDEPQRAARVIEELLRTPELPTDGVEQVEEKLDDVEERLGRIVPIEDVPALVPEPVVPEPVEAPALVIELDPVEATPPPVPDAVPPVAPPAELPDPGASGDEAQPAPDPSEPTALLVLDDQTADELGLRSRMTVPLSEAVGAALAILSERRGLALRIGAPGSAGQPRR